LKKEEGMEEYSQNFIFDIAQVILQPDDQRVVRLNEEAMVLAKAKRKAAIKKAYNELVYEDEIEGILDFHLEITIIQTR
jgi:3-methyladenine DNA glycosylase Tag